MVSREISNQVNYEIEIANFLKVSKKILHYKEINEFIFSKYKAIRNAVSYLTNSNECVKVAPGFYAHRDLITNEFYSNLDFEKGLINKFLRKQLILKNEVTIDNLTELLFDLQIVKLLSKNGIRYFISNISNIDDDLKRSCIASKKKFVLKRKSDECGHNKEKIDRATPTKLLAVDKNNIYSPLNRKISNFNLSVRSRHCLKTANVTKVKDLVQYTESDLLGQRNFGRKSLREVKEVLSSLGLRLGMTTADIEYFEAHHGATPTELLGVDNSKNDANILFKTVPWMVPVVAKFLARIIMDERATVGEVLSIKGPKGSEIKISDALSSIGFWFFGDIYNEVYESLPENFQIIAKKRIHAYSPLSLNDLGTEFGLTRERVRQLEIKVRDKFAIRFKKMDVAIQSRVMRALLGKVVPLRSAWKLSKKLINSSRHPKLAFFALLELAGPYKINKNWIVRYDALDRVNLLRSMLLDQADRIGRIDPLILGRETAGLFRREEEKDRFLLEYLNLPRIFDEWVVKDSQRKRVFLSLYKIGQPATKEEIANYAGIEDSSLIGRYFGGNDFICRADKERWAFIEWVDDPYDGIAGEIEQRIEEDGGKTTLERILAELPSKFGVAEGSVRAYLATPKFIIKDGYVRCATQDEIHSTYFGDVEDVSTAVRLEDGSWGARIKVEERFLAGYSAAIPAPIAWESGLEPGDSLLVPVDGTDHTVSLIWRVDNLLKTIDLGRIAPVLREFGLKQGDDIVVVPSIDGVRIFRAEEAPVMDPCEQEGTADPVHIESLMKVLFKR